MSAELLRHALISCPTLESWREQIGQRKLLTRWALTTLLKN